MRIIILSDTHGLHGFISSVPDGDVLIHAGDRVYVQRANTGALVILDGSDCDNEFRRGFIYDARMNTERAAARAR
jgi:predicted phosphodiesterase